MIHKKYDSRMTIVSRLGAENDINGSVFILPFKNNYCPNFQRTFIKLLFRTYVYSSNIKLVVRLHAYIYLYCFNY